MVPVEGRNVSSMFLTSCVTEVISFFPIICMYLSNLAFFDFQSGLLLIVLPIRLAHLTSS